MASPRERDHRGETWRPPTNVVVRPTPRPQPTRPRRHHFHDVPPWPHQRYQDYIYVDGAGWWPRWFPYWDASWNAYWWYLYDYYGGDASPAYAEYAGDALLRQQAPQWGLVVSGTGLVARDPRVPYALQTSAPATTPRQHYPHPHYYYGDYVSIEGVWWPRWFPYWDPAWNRYWWKLYYYYGGDAHRDYAEYTRDAIARAYARQLGWVR